MAILSKFSFFVSIVWFCCCLFVCLLKLILFYNRVVYHYTRIFLILLPRPVATILDHTWTICDSTQRDLSLCNTDTLVRTLNLELFLLLDWFSCQQSYRKCWGKKRHHNKDTSANKCSHYSYTKGH